jgi:protein TonB
VSLARAFAISIVFHILLLWPAAVVWREAVPSAPLVASLRPSVAPVAPMSPAIALKSPIPESGKLKKKLTSPPLLSMAESRQELHVATPTDGTANSTASSETQAAKAAPDVHSAVSSALPPAAGLDADGLRSYRLALAREARRFKRYPSRAIERGWGGTVDLRVIVPSDRGLPVVQLTKSSGYPALDEAALDMLRQALPTTPIPAPLQEQGFSVELPIVFELPQ